MSTKKKVQFNEKATYKKFKSNKPAAKEAGEPSDEDYGNNSDDEFKEKKSKHTLDSDEEDNADKYESLNRECLKGKSLSNLESFLLI